MFNLIEASLVLHIYLYECCSDTGTEPLEYSLHALESEKGKGHVSIILMVALTSWVPDGACSQTLTTV